MAGMDTLDEVLHALVEMTTAELNAERGTLFLNDPETNELYSRVAQGNVAARNPPPEQQRHRRARVHLRRGPHHRRRLFRTRASTARSTSRPASSRAASCACRSRTAKGEIIGVAQMLNKQQGQRSRKSDLEAARSDDDAGHAGAAERAVHRAHEGDPQAGDGIPRHRVGGDRRHQARLAAAESHGRGDAHAQRRALDAVPQRREDQRAVVRGRAGAGGDADPPAQPPRHRRRGVHHRQDHQHSLRLRRPALQSRRSTRRPATSRAPSCACRSSTSTARSSASRRC